VRACEGNDCIEEEEDDDNTGNGGKDEYESMNYGSSKHSVKTKASVSERQQTSCTQMTKASSAQQLCRFGGAGS
jgi:hypothetical protein